MVPDSSADSSRVSVKDIQNLSNKVPVKRSYGFPKLYLAAFSSLLYPFSMGVAGAFSAVCTANMNRRESRIRPDEDEVTWIGSLITLGSLFGGAIAGYVTQKSGRKGAMMIYSLPFIAGWLFIAYATNVIQVYIGRFLTGASVGAVCAVTPTYLAEISTTEIRGRLGSVFQVNAGLGALIGTSFGFFLNWSWQAVVSSICVLLALALISFMPESPTWLLSNGQRNRAVRALKFLHGSDFDAESECALIEESLSSKNQGKIKLIELLKPELLKPIILAIGIIVFQQLSGTLAIVFYAVEDFKKLSVPISPYGATMLLHAVLTIATVCSGYFMDRLGRKIMLVSSGLGMAVTLFILAGFTYANSLNADLDRNYSWVPLVDIYAYIITYSIGYGPIPWVMISEISPNRIRGLIGGIASAFCWGFAFMVTKSVDFLNSHLGIYGTYCLYGGFCVLSCFFVILCLPETKGKRFEEIQKFFEKNKNDKHDLTEISDVSS